MQSSLNNSIQNELSDATADELHCQALQHLCEINQLISEELPGLMSQIIKQEVWKGRNNAYKSFGEYALAQSPDGLGIANNDMLWLLKAAMNKKSEHPSHWADVLCEVDTHVRSYAKKKKIPIHEFQGHLSDYDTSTQDITKEDVITYLPSRSNSNDGQLLKLKKKDPEAYEHVIQGNMKLKEAWPQTPRKKLNPIDAVKNKFSNLSQSDRDAFLAWLEQEKENFS